MPGAEWPIRGEVWTANLHRGWRTERRDCARSLRLAPSLRVMSYIDIAHADRRPVQRTGLGVAVGRGCPSMLWTNGLPTLARSFLARPMRQIHALPWPDGHV